MREMIVLLPQPEAPTSAVVSPALKKRFTPLRACSGEEFDGCTRSGGYSGDLGSKHCEREGSNHNRGGQ